MEKLETLIKSICSHNHNMKFYIFNDDLPSEWFQLMEKRLESLESEIVNVIINSEKIKDYHTPGNHIRYNTYFRYFIGEVVEESTALYLDCDMIVDGSLSPLFELDLSSYYLASVKDAYPWEDLTFNAGMMVVNVTRWREEKIVDQLLSLTDQYHEMVHGDQGILNMLFPEGKWLALPERYDVMVGFDLCSYQFGDDAWWFDRERWEKVGKPAIIHYEGPDKPWKQKGISRYRKLWWFYYALEWSDILLRKPLVFGDFQAYTNIRYHTAIFTDSADMPHLRELVQALPEVQFHVLAYSYFAPWLHSLTEFSNITFYPAFNPFQEREVLKKMDFYLDINHYNEIADITNRVHELGKPIFGFHETSHDSKGGSYLYEVDTIEEMISDIRSYMRGG